MNLREAVLSKFVKLWKWPAIGVAMGVLLGPVVGAQTQFLGPSFVVNNPDRTDSFPNVDTNPAGTSVVVWTCDQAGVGGEICGRRLSLTGRLSGQEFLVNTTSSGVQQFADVAVDGQGNFFVVWESSGGEDGTGFTVLGRVYNPSGVPSSGQIVLNSLAAGNQRNPAVAWQPGSGWVVVWDSTHAGAKHIMARRFAANGSPKGAEKLVSENPPLINISAGGNVHASVDADSNGNFVVAWQGLRVFEVFGGSTVYGRRFLANGSSRGKSFRVPTNAELQKDDPSVSVNASGAFVIVFSRGDGSIAVRRYKSNGQPKDAEFAANQGAASTIGGAAALADNGRFVAAWTSASGAIVPGRFSVFQRVFGSNGQPTEPEQIVSQLGQTPHVAMDAAGDALVVFHGTGPDAGARFAQTRSLCTDTSNAVCVSGGRFKVEVAWRSNNGDVGVGAGDLLTDDTATFWFFSADNIELALKNLDACDFTATYWVFAAGATDVEVDLAVTDTEAGIVRRWIRPLGVPFETIRDVQAFACDGARSSGEPGIEARAAVEGLLAASATVENPLASSITRRETAAQLGGVASAGATCVEGQENLCLNQSRFEIRVRYPNSHGQLVPGTAIPLTADSGYYWFFAADNVEVLVKVLDACSFNQRFWVLAAGLTDLAAEIQVRDTITGQTKVYRGQAGQGFVPVIDTSAFATCL